ncbi:hypothetical protein HanRHA438_Chr15g0694131 [Helianthus annuus]|nr:hypothetical protein HanRHA438_Chr15g0694131 [Helianthus annuus]
MENPNLHHLHGRSGPIVSPATPQHHTHKLCYLCAPVVFPAEAPPRFSGDPQTFTELMNDLYVGGGEGWVKGWLLWWVRGGGVSKAVVAVNDG